MTLSTRCPSKSSMSWNKCVSMWVLSIYLSVCLSVPPSFCLSICLSVRPSFCLSIYLSIYLYVCPSVCLSVRPSFCLSIYLSVCLSVRRSVYLSICLSVVRSVCLTCFWVGGWWGEHRVCGVHTDHPTLQYGHTHWSVHQSQASALPSWQI